ncbi:MAG: hypothetical protein ACPG7F_04285 [Aggregatilineales bacterium]
MRKQARDFRKEEVNYVMKRWKGSESCSLVGVGSVGKSNLIHHLIDEDTQTNYLGSQQTTLLKPIMIDPNMLGPLPANKETSEQFRCWAGYELMMHRLYLALYPLDILGDDADDFFETYQLLQDGTNPLYAYMGLRYFELALEFLLRKGIQVIFLFDEFEEMLKQMPVKFFLTLRGMRDNHKSNLSYLTFTREPIPVLVDRMNIPELAIEPFTELFTDNLYFVGPYNDKDARDMLNRLIKRNQRTNYPAHMADFVLYASGRFAGILRATFRMADTLGMIQPRDIYRDEIIDKLAARPAVRIECQTIWKSLTPIEQEVLKAVARLRHYEVNDETEQAIALLVRKNLVQVDNERQTLHIEPPVFRSYVASNPDVV